MARTTRAITSTSDDYAPARTTRPTTRRTGTRAAVLAAELASYGATSWSATTIVTIR